MIDNMYSGHTYHDLGNTVVRTDGAVFVKQGSTWTGSNGTLVQESGDITRNLKTGVHNRFGDLFGDDDAMDL